MKKTNRIITILIFVFLYAPMVVLILGSFNTGKNLAVFEGFTLQQYAELFRDKDLLALLGNSLLIAILSTAIATAFGTFAAVGIHNLKPRMRKAVMSLTNIPMTNPDIVTGISLSLLFVFIGTGLLGQRPSWDEEYFVDSGETVRGIGKSGKVGMQAAGMALSLYREDEDVASYRYANWDGHRFLVLGCNFHEPGVTTMSNYFCSWARRKQLQENIPWLCGKELPGMLTDAPDAHVLVKRDEHSMAVAIVNSYYDEILDPVIPLGKVYKIVRFVNCSGRLEGDKVRLDTLPPFGFAAFEVS